MTQTPRDWQKDMAFILREKERVQIFHLDTKEEDIAIHWLQEAKRLKEESSEAVEGLYQIIQRGDLTSFDLEQAKEVYKRFSTTLVFKEVAHET